MNAAPAEALQDAQMNNISAPQGQTASAGEPAAPNDAVSKFSSEVDAIRDLIEGDLAPREQQEDRRTRAWQVLRNLLFPGASRITLLLGLFVLAGGFLSKSDLTLLAGLGLLGIGILIEFGFMVRDLIRTVMHRHIEAVKNSRAFAEEFDHLFKQLLPYSRAALLKVADDLTTFDSIVDKRIATILGQGRGGLLTVFTFGIAGFTAIQKVLEGNTIPSNLHEPLWWIFLAMMSMALGAVFGRHSVNITTTYAGLLRQVASAKETMEKEAKEARERQKEPLNSAPSSS